MHMHTCIYISPQLVHARLCNGAAASLPWKLLRTYLESCANIVQAVVSAHPPAPSSSRQPSCWPVARHARLRNPIKSTLAHDAVAAVVLHKHHLIIRVGAGLIQFVYGSHSRLAADLTLDKNLFSLPFLRGFYYCAWGRAITRLRTRSAAVRHCRDFSLSAYERDLVTNEKVQFRSFVPNRPFEDSFFHPSRPSNSIRDCRESEVSLSSLEH